MSLNVHGIRFLFLIKVLEERKRATNTYSHGCLCDFTEYYRGNNTNSKIDVTYFLFIIHTKPIAWAEMCSTKYI